MHVYFLTSQRVYKKPHKATVSTEVDKNGNAMIIEHICSPHDRKIRMLFTIAVK